VELGRRYGVTLAVALLAGGGYVGVTQVSAAEQRARARADAAESARYAAEVKAFEVKAKALLNQFARPPGFTPTGGVQGSPCNLGVGVTSCFLTFKTPRPALDAMLDAVRPLGLKTSENDCKLPSESSAGVATLFGATPPPCAASGTVAGLPFSVTSFPQRDRVHSTKGHIAFSGSRVSFSFIHV
jgi:hypothetical protein